MHYDQALTLTFVQTVSTTSLSLQAKNIHQEEFSQWLKNISLLLIIKHDLAIFIKYF